MAAFVSTPSPITVKPERWRRVPGFPDYRVSDRGGLQSRRGRNGLRLADGLWRDVKLSVDSQGYPGQHLTRKGRRRWFNLHQIVLLAFVGPRPEGLVSRHVHNPDPFDCRLDNLAYGTQKENCADKWRHGTWQRGPVVETVDSPDPAR